MNDNKRFRQLSLFDCVQISKKQKTANMDVVSSNKEKILCESTSKDERPTNQNVFDSTSEKIAKETNLNSLSLSNDVHDTENNVSQAACDFVPSSFFESEAGPSKAADSKIEDSQDTEDCSLKNSADLFPDTSTIDEDNHSSENIDHSQELFTEYTDSEKDSLGHQSSSDDTEFNSEPDDLLSVLNKTPDCCLPLPKLEPAVHHTILFSPHIRPGDAPRPYPSSYRDRWDGDHVRMPCSPLNRFPVLQEDNSRRIESRWDLICRSLRTEIGSSKELEAAIMKYNSQYKERWNFQGLHAFINKHLTEEERDHFFEVLLPGMIEVALDLPNVCTQPLPLLKREKDHYLTMSQKQIGCLLLNAFFCTFPRRTPPPRNVQRRGQSLGFEYSSFPDINFNRLFSGIKDEIPGRNAEKLKCLFNYFRRIIFQEPCGTVTFHRQTIKPEKLPRWHSSTRGLRAAVIKSQGLIEKDGRGMLQADFANKYIGGGVLGHGCVQEEIRFVVCPELIVSRLFVEYLDFNEALIVTGVEQYNKYSGYANTFKWEGDFKDETPRDTWGRRFCQLVAIDAVNFRKPSEQFKVQFIKRELNKAYSGFYENTPATHLPAVATGNWGCGAFKGNVHLKFLLQLMAASEAGRSILYLTFGNKTIKRDLLKMHTFLSDNNLAVGDLWKLLMLYADKITPETNLYDFIYAQFDLGKKVT